VLAEVALALRALRHEARAGHLVADAAQQRLDPRGAEQRVVDVVEVGGLEVAVVLPLGVLVGRAVEDELELGAGVRGQAVTGEPLQLPAQDLARRGEHVARAVEPGEVGQGHDGRRLPRHPPQGREVGHHREVAVAAVPAGHRVALDGVHVDVDGEQVVAALAAVGHHLVDEERAVEPLSLEAALHVGEGEHHGVDLPAVDRDGELLDRQRGGAGHARASKRHVKVYSRTN
jgi:hypothetical protein